MKIKFRKEVEKRERAVPIFRSLGSMILASGGFSMEVNSMLMRSRTLVIASFPSKPELNTTNKNIHIYVYIITKKIRESANMTGKGGDGEVPVS